jgi:hypothetical protein
MREHNEDEKYPEGRRRHREEINGCGLRRMIRQEGSQVLAAPRCQAYK